MAMAVKKGRVCKWQDVDWNTGCCPSVDGSTAVNSCIECKENCCAVYAYCVSCCLQPENPIHPNFTNPNIAIDKFDYCRAVCRTSSRSVVNENKWKSDLKYCFPNQEIYLLPANPTTISISDEGAPVKYPEQVISERVEDTSNDLKGISNIKEKIYKSNTYSKVEPDTPVPPSPEQSETVKVEEGIDATLNEIVDTQKKQESLLEKLEEKMKKLVEENQYLAEENKNLSDKLEQATNGQLALEVVVKEQEFEEKMQIQNQIQREQKLKLEKTGEATSSSSRGSLGGLVVVLLLILGWVLVDYKW